jgi:hypothetical protein
MHAKRVFRIAGLSFLPMVLTAASGGQGQSQHPLVDKLAAKVVQKYQSSSCEQLRMEKATKQAPSPQEQKIIEFLKGDAQTRTIFINQVAAPIANKMFECGMIP